MQYKKPPRDEKPSELRTVWGGVRGGNVGEYFSLVFFDSLLYNDYSFNFCYYLKEKQ